CGIQTDARGRTRIIRGPDPLQRIDYPNGLCACGYQPKKCKRNRVLNDPLNFQYVSPFKFGAKSCLAKGNWRTKFRTPSYLGDHPVLGVVDANTLTLCCKRSCYVPILK